VGSVIHVDVVVDNENDDVFAEAVNGHGFVIRGDSVVSRVLCPELDMNGRQSCGWPRVALARHRLGTPGVQAMSVKDQRVAR
jgi:hypothetical protein